MTVIINTVLEEVQGFHASPGVIIIGATNNLEAVDPALRRPGRLDRIVAVPYPNVAALARIYDYYLERAQQGGAILGPVNTMRLGQLTFGRTGAHVELYVRAAARRARRDGQRPIIEQDLLAEITQRPAEGYGLKLSEDEMRRIAVHEAGHAIVALTGESKGDEVAMISIVPRSDGTLGFVARSPDSLVYSTRPAIEESIRITLGGRAAEEIIFGRDDISAGAGGAERSDLGQATDATLRLLTRFGYSQSGGLLWLDWRPDRTTPETTAEAIRNLPMGDQVLAEARTTLERLYAETIARLAANREKLSKLVDLLMQKQEISCEEMKSVLENAT